MDLKAFEAELQSQHAALTAAYQHAKEHGTRKEHAEAKAALVQFRADHGHVIKALEARAVTVEE